jgi:hypothetical protein
MLYHNSSELYGCYVKSLLTMLNETSRLVSLTGCDKLFCGLFYRPKFCIVLRKFRHKVPTILCTENIAPTANVESRVSLKSSYVKMSALVGAHFTKQHFYGEYHLLGYDAV